MNPARDGAVDERGSASVHVLAVCIVLAALAVVAVQVAGAVAVRHRAAAAADLAALAAAAAEAGGRPGCPAAARVAAANAASLARCRTVGGVATVRVEHRAARVLGRTWTVARTARAAPRDWAVPDRPPGRREGDARGERQSRGLVR